MTKADVSSLSIVLRRSVVSVVVANNTHVSNKVAATFFASN